MKFKVGDKVRIIEEYIVNPSSFELSSLNKLKRCPTYPYFIVYKVESDNSTKFPFHIGDKEQIYTMQTAEYEIDFAVFNIIEEDLLL